MTQKKQETKKQRKQKEERIYAKIPKEFINAPIFASTPQKGPREVMVNGKKWVIGDIHPLEFNTEKGKMLQKMFPALDIRHGKLIFIILSKFKATNYNWREDLHISLYDLCKDYFDGTIKGQNYKKVASLLLDLCYTKIRVYETERKRMIFSIIHEPVYQEILKNKKNGELEELWLEYISLNPRFVDYIETMTSMLKIRLDRLLRLKNPLSAAVYTYIPSRAWHHTKEKPFEITLSNLLEQLGENVPKYKSKRKEKFIREDGKNKHNVIKDLDNIEINNYKLLRCELAETKDKKDYKLLFYTEDMISGVNVPKDYSGTLYNKWREFRSRKEWLDRTRRVHKIEFDLYEKDALNIIGDWEDSEDFLKLAKCLLGSEFTTTLGYVKNDVLEGNGLRNPMAVLIASLMKKVDIFFFENQEELTKH